MNIVYFHLILIYFIELVCRYSLMNSNRMDVTFKMALIPDGQLSIRMIVRCVLMKFQGFVCFVIHFTYTPFLYYCHIPPDPLHNDKIIMYTII